ncbi:MAG: hypothetical protein PGN13_16160 [Patulibacter minatonensis]
MPKTTPEREAYHLRCVLLTVLAHLDGRSDMSIDGNWEPLLAALIRKTVGWSDDEPPQNERAAEFERRVGSFVPLSIRFGTDAERVEWLLSRDASPVGERNALQEAVDSALGAMRDSEYVGGAFTERTAWQHVMRVLGPFETNAAGECPR